MRHRLLISTSLGCALTAAAVGAPLAGDRLDERRSQCFGWMVDGYPSGIEETSCTAQFDLPSPFLFKCARAERRGYETALQKKACATYLADASKAAERGVVRVR